MITYKNGTQKTAVWEDIPSCIYNLGERTLQYNHHISELSKRTFNLFKTMKYEYDNDYIQEYDYIEYLKILKDYFVKYTVHHAEVKKDEILAEVKRMGIK